MKYSWNGDYLKVMPRGQMILAQKEFNQLENLHELLRTKPINTAWPRVKSCILKYNNAYKNS